MYKIIGTDQKEYGPISADQLRQWVTEGRVHGQSLAKLDGASQWQPINVFPEFAGLGGMQPPPANLPRPDDTVATMIPYRNPKALIAYYLGIFSIIPILGFFLGVAAFILGIQGLKIAKQNPQAKGKVHAWIGIICGGVFGLLYFAAIVLIIIGIAAKNR